MKDDYQIKGPRAKVEFELEKDVVEKLAAMEKQTKHTKSEMANTALKRFIAQHKDFFPIQ
ncbi:MAG: hypothetical protein AAB116_27070 [Candidatus Poribacteria bacterium]